VRDKKHRLREKRFIQNFVGKNIEIFHFQECEYGKSDLSRHMSCADYRWLELAKIPE
jgi:hypothetical protein